MKRQAKYTIASRSQELSLWDLLFGGPPILNATNTKDRVTVKGGVYKRVPEPEPDPDPEPGPEPNPEPDPENPGPNRRPDPDPEPPSPPRPDPNEQKKALLRELFKVLATPIAFPQADSWEPPRLRQDIPIPQPAMPQQAYPSNTFQQDWMRPQNPTIGQQAVQALKTIQESLQQFMSQTTSQTTRHAQRARS
jgi:hypothetical protein